MILYALALAAAAPKADHGGPAYTCEQAEQDLQAVIRTFGEAIVRKDTDRFLALFAEGPVTWQRVNSDARLARLGPAAVKAGFEPANTPGSFIERIAQSRHRYEEIFSNIRIDHDHDVAAVTFDFIYTVNGRAINAGKESWHLVRGTAGWRIVSVIYSNNDPAP